MSKKGVVYKRTDKNGGKYIGQAKSDARYKARQKEHDRSNPLAEYKFKEVGRAKPGKDLDVLEQKKNQPIRWFAKKWWNITK